MGRNAVRLIGAVLVAVVASVALVSRGSATHSVDDLTMKVAPRTEKHLDFQAAKSQIFGYYGDLLDDTTLKSIASYKGTCVWLGEPGKMRATCNVVINFLYGTPGNPQGGATLTVEGHVDNPGTTLFATAEQERPRLVVTGGTGRYLGAQGDLQIQLPTAAVPYTTLVFTWHP
jgi:hypothetical protein